MGLDVTTSAGSGGQAHLQITICLNAASIIGGFSASQRLSCLCFETPRNEWAPYTPCQVFVNEFLVPMAQLDIPYWSALIAHGGYNSPAGFKKIAQAVLPKVASLSASQLAQLSATFHR